MIKAELGGKIPSQESHEDVLTSNVFGALYYLNRSVVWQQFTREILGLEFSAEELEATSFEFWPFLEGRNVESAEPDLVISIGDKNIVVECKLGSELYEEQLEREIEVAKEQFGTTNDSPLHLLTITADWGEPSLISTIREKHSDINVKWANWQTVCAQFKKIAELSETDSSTKRMLDDLVELMHKKGLRVFMGIQDGEIELIEKSLEPQKTVYREFCILRDLLLGEFGNHGIVRNSKNDRVWRDGCSRSPASLSDWITRHLLADFRSEEWVLDKYWFSHYLLFIKLLFTEKEKPFWYGYRIEIWNEDEMIYIQDKASIIADFAIANNYEISIRDTEEQRAGDHVFRIISPKTFTELDFMNDDVCTIEITKRVQVGQVDPVTILGDLVILRDFINKEHLIPININ